MKTVTIYYFKEINDLDELAELMNSGAPACYDPSEDRCECKKCIKYEITIEKIAEKKL